MPAASSVPQPARRPTLLGHRRWRFLSLAAPRLSHPQRPCSSSQLPSSSPQFAAGGSSAWQAAETTRAARDPPPRSSLPNVVAAIACRLRFTTSSSTRIAAWSCFAPLVCLLLARLSFRHELSSSAGFRVRMGDITLIVTPLPRSRRTAPSPRGATLRTAAAARRPTPATPPSTRLRTPLPRSRRTAPSPRGATLRTAAAARRPTPATPPSTRLRTPLPRSRRTAPSPRGATLRTAAAARRPTPATHFLIGHPSTCTAGPCRRRRRRRRPPRPRRPSPPGSRAAARLEAHSSGARPAGPAAGTRRWGQS